MVSSSPSPDQSEPQGGNSGSSRPPEICQPVRGHARTVKELGECQQALAQAHLDLHRESCPTLTLTKWGEILGNGGLDAIIKLGHILILQAVVAGCVVGYVSCETRPRGTAGDRRPHAKINHLSVRETHRGRGIGHMLLTALAALLRDKFPKCLSLVKLTVAAKNAGALRLYDACGFKEVDTYTSEYFEGTPKECSVDWKTMECETGLRFHPCPQKPVRGESACVPESAQREDPGLLAQAAEAEERDRRSIEEKEAALKRQEAKRRRKAEEREDHEDEEERRSKKKRRQHLQKEVSAPKEVAGAGQAVGELGSSRPAALKAKASAAGAGAKKKPKDKRSPKKERKPAKEVCRAKPKTRAAPPKPPLKQQRGSRVVAPPCTGRRVHRKAKDDKGRGKPKASAQSSRR